jgi:UDP-glucuronate 4-epimerase
MRIFISGIAGFIGFHLALALKKRGHVVIGCDNFNDYYDVQLKRDRAQQLQEGVFEFDIRNKELLDQVIREHQIAHFVHLAAQAGVRHSLQYPESYIASNLDGFIQIMEVLKRHPRIPLTYASSSSVYGCNRKIPFSETDPTDTPCNLYGATKKSNELIAHAYHQIYGIPVTGLRYFTVYGPWGRPDMAYFSFTRAMMQDLPLQIYNQGAMQRDFTYIDDIVQGTIAAIELAAPCEIFNLGNNRPQEIFTLVGIIEKALEKKARLNLLPMQPGESTITYADITKSQNKLGFSPKTSLEEGMEQFIRWYQTYYAAPLAASR